MMTHNATKVFAPAAVGAVLVEAVEQDDEDDDDEDEEGGADDPPGPPEGLAALEEPDGVAVEGWEGNASDSAAAAAAGNVRVRGAAEVVLADLAAQGVRGVQDGDAEAQADNEAADVGEVVEARQEAEGETDQDLDDEEGQLAYGVAALAPGVEEVEQGQGDDAEKGARGAGGGDGGAGVVGAEDVGEDAGGHVDEEETDGANDAFDFPTQGHLQQQVEADVDDAGVHEYGNDEAPPLVRKGLGVQAGSAVGVIGLGNAAETTDLGEGTFHGIGLKIVGGGPGTGPVDGLALVLDALGVMHAGRVAGAHVDEHGLGGSDHGVEGGFCLDGAASQLGCLDHLTDENTDLDSREQVDHDGDSSVLTQHTEFTKTKLAHATIRRAATTSLLSRIIDVIIRIHDTETTVRVVAMVIILVLVAQGNVVAGHGGHVARIGSTMIAGILGEAILTIHGSLVVRTGSCWVDVVVKVGFERRCGVGVYSQTRVLILFLLVCMRRL